MENQEQAPETPESVEVAPPDLYSATEIPQDYWEQIASEPPRMLTRAGTGIKYTGAASDVMSGGGRKGYNYYPQYMIKEIEAEIEKRASQTKEESGLSKADKKRFGEEIIPIEPELTPKEKADAAFAARIKEEAAQAQVQASEKQQEPILKPQRGLGIEARYKEALIKKAELEQKYKEQEIQSALERQVRINKQEEAREARAQQAFEFAQKEKLYKYGQEQEAAQLRQPITQAELQAATIRAQQNLRPLEKQEKEYHFRQTLPGKIATAAENINEGLSIKNLTAGLQGSIQEASKANIKPNIEGLLNTNPVIASSKRGKVQQAIPTPAVVPAYQSIDVINSLDITARGIGGSYQGNFPAKEETLGQVGGHVLHSGDEIVILEKVGGRARTRG